MFYRWCLAGKQSCLFLVSGPMKNLNETVGSFWAFSRWIYNNATFPHSNYRKSYSCFCVSYYHLFSFKVCWFINLHQRQPTLDCVLANYSNCSSPTISVQTGVKITQGENIQPQLFLTFREIKLSFCCPLEIGR